MTRASAAQIRLSQKTIDPLADDMGAADMNYHTINERQKLLLFGSQAFRSQVGFEIETWKIHMVAYINWPKQGTEIYLHRQS